jgi:hypothetical protein
VLLFEASIAGADVLGMLPSSAPYPAPAKAVSSHLAGVFELRRSFLRVVIVSLAMLSKYLLTATSRLLLLFCRIVMRMSSRFAGLLSYQQKLLNLISIKQVDAKVHKVLDVLLKLIHDCGVVECGSSDVANADLKLLDVRWRRASGRK